MKTKFIVMAAMAAMFSMGFTACSNNDDNLAGKEIAQSHIGFDVKAYGMNTTRGDATIPGNLQFTDFQTWAYDATTDGLYMGDNATTGRTVTYAAGVWGYTPTQFWPVNELNFVSIAPATAAASNSTASSSGVVTLTSNLVIPTAVASQNDIMFACGKDNTSGTPVKGPVAKDDHDGDVPLVFEHALSQIVFKGKLPTSGAVTEVEIAEISLGNIGSTGTVNFTSAGTWFNGTDAYIATTVPAKYTLLAANLEQALWGVGGTGDTNDDATAGEAFNLTVSNSAADKHNAWFLLPQRTAAWKYYAGENEASATAEEKAKLKAGGLWSGSANVEPSGAFLKIRATLKKNGVTILQNREQDAIYIPLVANWDRSKKYTYTIEFNGLSALTPITFSVTAENWTDGGNTDLQM